MRTNPGFGLRINNTRCDRNMSQVELAAAIGTAQPNLSRWEREIVSPGRTVFEALGRALGVTADWLMYGNAAPPAPQRRAPKLHLGLEARWATPENAERAATSKKR